MIPIENGGDIKTVQIQKTVHIQIRWLLKQATGLDLLAKGILGFNRTMGNNITYNENNNNNYNNKQIP